MKADSSTFVKLYLEKQGQIVWFVFCQQIVMFRIPMNNYGLSLLHE